MSHTQAEQQSAQSAFISKITRPNIIGTIKLKTKHKTLFETLSQRRKHPRKLNIDNETSSLGWALSTKKGVIMQRSTKYDWPQRLNRDDLQWKRKREKKVLGFRQCGGWGFERFSGGTLMRGRAEKTPDLSFSRGAGAEQPGKNKLSYRWLEMVESRYVANSPVTQFQSFIRGQNLAFTNPSALFFSLFSVHFGPCNLHF